MLMNILLFAVFLPLVLYLALLVLVAFESVQRSLIFGHRRNQGVKTASLKHETALGLGAGSVRHFQVCTEDHVQLGAWQILPRNVYEAHIAKYGYGAIVAGDVFEEALHSAPIVLFAHGAHGNRGSRGAVRQAQEVSNTDLNFVTFDYRGYADSSPILPTEQGVITDLGAMWRWLTVDKGVSPNQIVLVGRSLGSAVIAAFAGRVLALDGISPRAVILISPFSTMAKILETARLCRQPVLAPLAKLPRLYRATPKSKPPELLLTLTDFFLGALRSPFNTREALLQIKAPVLLIHALDDIEVVHRHSIELFEMLAMRDDAKILETNLGEQVGRLCTAGQTVHVETRWGGHENAGFNATAMHFIRQIAWHGKIGDAETLEI